jgi:predicted HTH transcriptional regulator
MRGKMSTPLEIFENPSDFMSFLTSGSDNDFESQFFDRKEVGRTNDGLMSQNTIDNVTSQIKECVSAFANAEGGLLVLGISKVGSIKGIGHLSENQIIRITSLNQLLKFQSTSLKFFECTNDQGVQNKILLILVYKSEHGICETITSNPQAWLRVGPQNQPMTDDMRDLLKREKRITDYERTSCCPYDPADLDKQVVSEFRRAISPGSQISDQDLLYQAGALERDVKGALFFNNAGFLFFANNPTRVLSWAHVRLLRFNARVS